jgi:hypothetical protein
VAVSAGGVSMPLITGGSPGETSGVVGGGDVGGGGDGAAWPVGGSAARSGATAGVASAMSGTGGAMTPLATAYRPSSVVSGGGSGLPSSARSISGPGESPAAVGVLLTGSSPGTGPGAVAGVTA